MNKLQKLLWKVCGFDARARRQKLRHKLQLTLCMDELKGWLRTYGDAINWKEVGV